MGCLPLSAILQASKLCPDFITLRLWSLSTCEPESSLQKNQKKIKIDFCTKKLVALTANGTRLPPTGPWCALCFSLRSRLGKGIDCYWLFWVLWPLDSYWVLTASSECWPLFASLRKLRLVVLHRQTIRHPFSCVDDWLFFDSVLLFFFSLLLFLHLVIYSLLFDFELASIFRFVFFLLSFVFLSFYPRMNSRLLLNLISLR